VEVFDMNGNDSEEVVIPAEEAVFWMDGRGRWCNRHGPFRNPKIIAHFNRCLDRDDGGWFVGQVRDGRREKVYFRYEETPLLAVDLTGGPALELVLNTGGRLPLKPEQLRVKEDALFQGRGPEGVRLSERAMVKLASLMETSEEGLVLHLQGKRYVVPEGGETFPSTPSS
jgi:hypothetical protein